jgi:cytochrome c nitrite reductase small subunit
MIVASIVLGGAIGLGGFTFFYARGGSYLTNDPAACANCHVMRAHLDAWQKSTHHAVAVCNDCHAPSGGFGKYWTKMVNGFNHSVAFTSGVFHEPIRITARNRSITEAQCRRCHGDIVEAVDGPPGAKQRSISCIRCHESVGHRVSD